MLCALGAVGGLLIASIGLELLRAFAPGEIPRLGGVGIDVVATAFSGRVPRVPVAAAYVVGSWAAVQIRTG